MSRSPQPLEPGLSAAAYRTLLEHLPEGVVVADAQRTLVLANTRAGRLTGLPLAERIGSDIRTALPLKGADGRSYWLTDDPWGGLRTISGSPEQRLMLPGGRSVLAATRHVRGDSPRELQWLVMTMRSSTVRDRIESETSALVATVAHELRAPLGAVRGFSQTLRSRWGQLRDDQKLWMLGAIDADAARLQRQVGELLDISRIDAGRLQLRKGVVDLLPLVRSSVERMVSTGYDAARFTVTSDEAAMLVEADPDRLTQVVSNLLENAVRHGGGSVAVTVRRVGDDLQLDVADDGPGIAWEHRSLVFSRYWQARGRTGAGNAGNGLGLFIVQGLVHAHGGRIEVLRRTGGATFRVSLPAHPDAQL